MNSIWMISCILCMWIILKKTQSRRRVSNHSFNSIRTGVFIGILLSLFDVQIAYNTIVTKTKRLVSLDTVSSFIHQHTNHTLFMVFLSYISFLVSHTQVNEHVPERIIIPIWSQMIGAGIGLLIGSYITIYHHRQLLNGQ